MNQAAFVCAGGVTPTSLFYFDDFRVLLVVFNAGSASQQIWARKAGWTWSGPSVLSIKSLLLDSVQHLRARLAQGAGMGPSGRTEPSLLPCKCQASASGGATSVPEHPSAPSVPSPSDSALCQVPTPFLPPEPADPPAGLGGDKDSVTPRECDGWGPSVGPQGELGVGWVSQFPSPIATPPSQSGNSARLGERPRGSPPNHPLRVSPPGAAAEPLRPPWSTPGSFSPSPPKAPTPELHENQIKGSRQSPTQE